MSKCYYTLSQFRNLKLSCFLPLVFISLATLIIFISITNVCSAQVNLTWDAPVNETNLAGYKLYYGNSSRDYDSSVDVGNQTGYTLSGLVSGETYYIAATAYDIYNNESDYSVELVYNVTIDESILPSTPTNLQATAISTSQPTNLQATAISTSQINLSWDASTDPSTGSGQTIEVAGYTIYRDGIQIANIANIYHDTELSSSTTYTYTVSAYDATGKEIVQSDEVAVTTLPLSNNNHPVLSPIGNKSVNEGQLLSFNIFATDLDGDTLNYTASNLPFGASFNESTQTFSWTPANNQTGTYSDINFQVSDDKDIDSESITITVGDGSFTDSEGVPITVINTNSAPVLDVIENIMVSEGATITLNPIATDPDGDDLTYTYSGWMTSASYTTDYDDAGTHTVIITVSDGMLTDSQDVTIIVSNLNRAPVLDLLNIVAVNEGVTVTLNPTATDPDGDALTYTYSGWMNSASYTTDYDDAGTYTVTVTVSDGSLSHSQDVIIIVNDVDVISPSTPANLQATAISPYQINLSWDASTDPSTGSGQATGVTGYKIYRSWTQVKTVINTGDTWKYFKGYSNPVSGWDDVFFDDSSWLEGPTGIGYGDGDDATVLSDMQGNYLTVYTRKTFNIPDASAVTGMTFSMDWDDGFIAYINGVEVARRNMPGGTIDFNTGASSPHEAGSPEEFDLSPYISNLVTGANVLSIEVRSVLILSDDLSLIPELEIENTSEPTQITTTASTTYQDTGLYPSTTYTYTISAYDGAVNASSQSSPASATTFEPQIQTTTIINTGDTWKYFKGYYNPGSGWDDVFFDDSSWLQGSTGIGYGDGDDATVLSDMQDNYQTVYARRTFNISDASAVTGMIFRIDYDDGFVAYINGQEVARANMPDGKPDYNTSANSRPEAGTPVTFDLTAYISYLVSGTNVLAIEVHNKAIRNSDLSLIPELEILSQ